MDINFYKTQTTIQYILAPLMGNGGAVNVKGASLASLIQIMLLFREKNKIYLEKLWSLFAH